MVEADNPQKAIKEAIKLTKPNAVVDITPTEDKSKCNCQVMLIGGKKHVDNRYIVTVKEKKHFDIPVEWTNYGKVRVYADTLEEAISILRDKSDEIPLTSKAVINADGTVVNVGHTGGDYIDGSYTIESDHGQNVKELAKYLKEFV